MKTLIFAAVLAAFCPGCTLSRVVVTRTAGPTPEVVLAVHFTAAEPEK